MEDSDAESERIPRFSAQAERDAFLLAALDASRIRVEGDTFVVCWRDDFCRVYWGTKAVVVARPARRNVTTDFIMLFWSAALILFMSGLFVMEVV